jgi:glycosyltransferase involved in cell wall biosynthesis
LKISVITATYNAQASVAEALESVLSQSHPDVELIVIDGASKDFTMRVLERYTINQLVSEPDNGIYDALNKGIKRATGDVVGFLHADDLFASTDVLANVAKVFENPDVDAVYGNLEYVSKENTKCVVRVWESGDFSLKNLKRGWMPPHPTLYLRRAWYERLGAFDTQYRIAADYDFMLRFLSQPTINIVYIPDVLVKMRVGGASNKSLKNLLRKSREDYAILRKNGIGGVGALIWKNLSKIPQFFHSVT